MTDFSAVTPTPNTPLRDLALTESLADPNANDLDKDAFLQLLVAQLRYQDPLDPSDPAEFMATTAQFTVVEKLDVLTQQGVNTAIISGLSMASSLVGRTVTYVGGDDAVATAVVSSAQVTNGEVRLVTDSGVVDLSTVVGIGANVGVEAPSATSAAPPQTTPTPTAPSTAPAAAGTAADASPKPASPVPATSSPEVDIPVVSTLPSSPVAIPTAFLPSDTSTSNQPAITPTKEHSS